MAEKRWLSRRSATRACIGIDAQFHSEQPRALPEYPDQPADVIDDKCRDTPAQVRTGTRPQQSIPDELNLSVFAPCSMRARVRHAESRPHRQGVARSTEGQIEGCERASFTEAFRSDALWTAIMVVLELPLRIGQRSEAAASERYARIDS